MAELQNGGDAGVKNAVVTPANSAASGTAYTLVTGSPIYDDTHVAHGPMAVKIVPAAGAACNVVFGSSATPLGGTRFNFRLAFHFDANPTTTFTLLQVNDSAGAAAVRVNLDSAGKIAWASNAGGAVTTRWQPTAGIPVGSFGRIEGYVELHGSTGVLDFATFANPNSDEPVESRRIEGLAFGAVTLRSVSAGKYGTDNSAAPFWIDDFYVNNAATGRPGSLKVPLARPVLALGKKTSITAFGATDGTQEVLWADIDGESRYDAFRGPGDASDESALALVASGVTSPYVFTGLAEGSHTYGIKPRA